MTIYAEVRTAGRWPLDPLPRGWWVRGVVVLEGEPRSAVRVEPEAEPDPGSGDYLMRRHFPESQETPSPEFKAAWPGAKPRTNIFLIDSGSEYTKLGTAAVRDFGLTLANTAEFPDATGADGKPIKLRGVNGQLWIEHRKPKVGRAAYSAFAVTYVMDAADVEANTKGKEVEEETDSLVGQDILDFLLTFGGMRKERPVAGRSTPITFDILPNWKLFRWFVHYRGRDYPHDAATFLATKTALNRGLRRLRVSPPT